MVSIGSVLPGFYWAQILLIAVWFIRLGLQQLQSRDGWSSTDLEDLVPELTDYTLQVLEKAPASAKQNETFECGLAPVSPADHTIGLHFSQSHFESLGSDFEGIILNLKEELVINFLLFHYRRFRSDIKR